MRLIGLIGLVGLIGLISPIAEAVSPSSDSFKSADSERVDFGGFATSTSFRNIGAGQAVIGTAESDSFKSEIGILYFEPPAEEATTTSSEESGGTIIVGGGGAPSSAPSEEETPSDSSLLEEETTQREEGLASTLETTERLLQSLRSFAMTEAESLQGAISPSLRGAISPSLRGVAEAISEIPKKVIQIVFPPKELEPPPIEGIVTATPPNSMNGQWMLLPTQAIKEFVLAPLPRDLRLLADKFPQVERTLADVGVRKVTDVRKLRDVTLTLPGLEEATGVPVVSKLVKKVKQIPAFSNMTNLEIARLSEEDVELALGSFKEEVVEREGVLEALRGIKAVSGLDLKPSRFALPSRIPLSELSLEYKKRVPEEFVFARAGGELIDLKTVLSLNEKGEAEQKVFAIAGKTLHLSVKPDGEARSVRGYLTYKGVSRSDRANGDFIGVKGLMGQVKEAVVGKKVGQIDQGSRIDQIDSDSIEAKDLVASAIFASPTPPSLRAEQSGAKQSQEITTVAPPLPRNDESGVIARNEAISRNDESGVIARNEAISRNDESGVIARNEAISRNDGGAYETELVVQEFEYQDPDKDGIWTADIQAPVVEGEYETITIIDYIDPVKGKQAVRLITVIDPEGYVFEWDDDRQIRIAGAITSLYWLNPETSEYELWPAEEFMQKNPQVTNVTGKYSFLTPEGTYYLKVEAPGYVAYEGKPFTVEEGRGVHFNISMSTGLWWLKLIDWKWITILLLILLVGYNYFRDMKREA